MLRGTPFLPKELFRIIQRQCWVIVLPFAIGVVATPFAAGALLERYRSEVMLAATLMETDDTAGGSKPTSSLAARIPSIRNRILSQSQLEQIARQLDLYPADRQSGAIADFVSRMRRDIDVHIAGDDVLRVSYLNRDPKIAQAVTARLASLFVAASSVGGRDAETAERFSIKVAATLPEKPYNQVRSMASVYGGLIGLVLGLALAVFRERQDLTLVSEDEVRRTLGVPVLGVISLIGADRDG